MGGKESTSTVEFSQTWLIINVQPFDSSTSRLLGAFFDQFSAEASSLPGRRDGGIEEKPMHAAIADDLGEADEPFPLVGAHVDQGTLEQGLRVDRAMVGPGAGEQCVEVFAPHCRANF